ncbi:MAG TPA: elongation factor G [Acidimicrobiales bacterium]|nr:elongation factor G [Acidimicrobiales bacterium]
MTTITTDRIRNVALVGHSGAGKTTLVEAMLFRAGLLTRIGRVEDGTTTTDTDPEEKSHGISLSLAVAPLDWKDHRVNVIDTPGDPDFVGEVRAALRVADLAVFVVSAVDGVEVGTQSVWRLCEELGVPRMVFINKLDRERASFERTLDDLRDRFGSGIAPLELPIGSEAGFHGIADLLTDTAWIYDSGHAEQTEIPDEMEELEHQIHDNLVEGIVVADDDLLAGYLEGETPSVEQLEHTLLHGVTAASVFPVVCGSATGPIAVDRLLDFICEIGPSPADRPAETVTAGDGEVEVAPDPAGSPLALVFKTVADPYVGQISLFRVLSGTIRADDHLVNPRTGADERLHGLFHLRGATQEPVTEVVAGDIAAVAKLSATATGDTLAPKGMPVTVPAPRWPEAVHSVAITARTQADEDKLATALHRLQEEDPVLALRHDDETHQTLLSGTGDTHLTVTLERLARKFGVQVDTADVQVAYRETITAEAEAEGRYKKQSGGHGQFGVATIVVEPLERGGGFEFVDQIVGGAIPRQFIPAVERGVAETMAEGGVLKGYPVVDVRVRCTDGKAHSVDSSEMSFRAAGRLGFREAMEKAEPVLLEPISELIVVVPTDIQGDVMGDLSSRRGKVSGTEPVGTDAIAITATVPTAEIVRYAIDLRSITGARGSFTARQVSYDVVPSHLAASVPARQ